MGGREIVINTNHPQNTFHVSCCVGVVFSRGVVLASTLRTPGLATDTHCSTSQLWKKLREHLEKREGMMATYEPVALVRVLPLEFQVPKWPSRQL